MTGPTAGGISTTTFPEHMRRQELISSRRTGVETCPLFIQLLGGLAVFSFGHQWRPPRRSMSHLLLAYLLSHPEETEIRREELASVLWPDEIGATARSRLRLCLHDLNATLPHHPGGDGWIIQTASSVAWRASASEDCRVDIWELCRIAGEIARARTNLIETSPLQLESLVYDLRALDRFLLPSHDSEWVSGERDRLGEIYLSQSLALAGMVAATGNIELALVELQRLIARDPSDERVHELLAHMHDSHRDSSASVATFQDGVTALLQYRVESVSGYSDPINEHRRNFLDRVVIEDPLSNGMPIQSSPHGDSSIYVDLESRLLSLAQVVDRNRIVAVVGPCGSGKSRCLRAYARSCDDAWRENGVSCIYIDMDLLRKSPRISWFRAGNLIYSGKLELLGILRALDEHAGPQLNYSAAALAESLLCKSVIMLLDNVDPYRESIRTLVKALVGESGHMRVVYASQLPLRVAGERVWRVPQLADGRMRLASTFMDTSEATLTFTSHGGRLPLNDSDRLTALNDIEGLVSDAGGLPLAAVLLAFASRQTERWSRTVLAELIWDVGHRCFTPKKRETSQDSVAQLVLPSWVIAERHESLFKASNVSAARSVSLVQVEEALSDEGSQSPPPQAILATNGAAPHIASSP